MAEWTGTVGLRDMIPRIRNNRRRNVALYSSFILTQIERKRVLIQRILMYTRLPYTEPHILNDVIPRFPPTINVNTTSKNTSQRPEYPSNYHTHTQHNRSLR